MSASDLDRRAIFRIAELVNLTKGEGHAKEACFGLCIVIETMGELLPASERRALARRLNEAARLLER